MFFEEIKAFANGKNNDAYIGALNSKLMGETIFLPPKIWMSKASKRKLLFDKNVKYWVTDV